MRSARHISSCPRRVGASLGLALLAFALVGCSSDDGHTHTGSSLLSGTRGEPVATRQLLPAVRVARRFAAAYARSVYRRRPPRLPGATAALRRDLLTAASRVPRNRRRLHPHALAVILRPRGAALAGVVKIADGRSPSFSVGFEVRKRGSRWRVVTISPPS
jgi:hypothetical protein